MTAITRSPHRRLLLVASCLATAAVLVLAAAQAAPKTLIVTKRHVAYKRYTTIQAAVNAAKPGDFVLIDKGVYPESVLVTTPGLHIRGLDRNRVILDGRHHPNTNGIEVRRVDHVYIENLTVRDFDRATPDGSNGNEIWWNGSDGSGVIGMHGWWGNYLTAYDTGLNSGYGEFTSNAVGRAFDHIYASGFGDSGFYIGACRDCQATLNHGISENNALGYSGTNAGGHLIIENTIFRHNSVGIAPSSLTPGRSAAAAGWSLRLGVEHVAAADVQLDERQPLNDLPQSHGRQQRQPQRAGGLDHGGRVLGRGHRVARAVRRPDLRQHRQRQPELRHPRLRGAESVPDGFHHAVLPAVGQQVLRQHTGSARAAASATATAPAVAEANSSSRYPRASPPT